MQHDQNHNHADHDHNEHDPADKSAKPSKLKEYRPLIAIIALIVILDVIWQSVVGSFTLMDSMRLFMGFFFLLFGLFKTFDWKGFVGVYAEYDIVTKVFRPWGYLYPVIELSLGVLYLGGWYLFETNIAAAIIMFVSSIGVIKAVSNKKRIRCACLGAVIKLPMTTVTIIEDLGMLAMALIMLAIM